MREERKDGGPAFPLAFEDARHGPYATDGMSLRDYFAAKAMQALIGVESDPKCNAWLGNPQGRTLDQWAAEAAYEYADAMLKARAK